MKKWLSLSTVRKKLLMLSKLAGAALVASYVLCNSLPVGEDVSFLIWAAFLLALVLGVDFFMGRFITKPVFTLNACAKRMAALDFSAPCGLASADEFGELAASLNTMAQSLQQALARLEAANAQLERDVERERLLLSERRELVDSLSHEMKTPLGIIRAYAEGLQDETEEAKKQKYARVIVCEAERMNGLLVTLLDLSALESGAAGLHITRFDLVELVETVAGRLLADAPGSRFELQYELPEQKAFVCTDRRRMEQVLENLLVNAKNNVVPGGILRLELAAGARMLHFSVFNQGRAIPEKDLSKIWAKFYRGSDAGYGGSGLGLSIVAQILSMQNFAYGSENLGDGVRFWFSLPFEGCEACP